MRRSEMTNFLAIRVLLLPERLPGFCPTSLSTDSRFAAAIGGWSQRASRCVRLLVSRAHRARETGRLSGPDLRLFDALVYDVVLRGLAHDVRARRRGVELPAIHADAGRAVVFVSGAETNAVAGPRRSTFRRTSGRAPRPRSLMIPQRGLYTGVMILGAVGTAKRRRAYIRLPTSWSAGRPEDSRQLIGGCSTSRGTSATKSGSVAGRRRRARRHRNRPGYGAVQPVAQRCRTVHRRVRESPGRSPCAPREFAAA
jgi:hypothetical protein